MNLEPVESRAFHFNPAQNGGSFTFLNQVLRLPFPVWLSYKALVSADILLLPRPLHKVSLNGAFKNVELIHNKPILGNWAKF